MNKKVLVVVAVVLVVLTGAGVLLMQRSNSPATTVRTNQMGSLENVEETTSSDSLRSLMALADRKQCTFKDTESGSSGTVYANSGRVRGDFQSSVDGVLTGSHMYTDGQEMYVWMDGQTTGFKMALSAVNSGGTNAMSKSVDLDKPVDYSCKNWSVDVSVFELPADVTFSDPTSMMQGEGMPSGIDVPQVSCSTCDSLTGDALSQCRAALGC